MRNITMGILKLTTASCIENNSYEHTDGDSNLYQDFHSCCNLAGMLYYGVPVIETWSE